MDSKEILQFALTSLDVHSKANYYQLMKSASVFFIRSFNCRIILLKHGIDFNQIAVSLNNSQRTFTTVETIQAAYDTLMKSHKTVLIASSIEASYISAMVSLLTAYYYFKVDA